MELVGGFLTLFVSLFVCNACGWNQANLLIYIIVTFGRFNWTQL